MIATILGVLMSKAGAYVALALAGIGVLFVTRQSGKQAARMDDLQRAVDDRAKADKIAAASAALPDDAAKSALLKEFSR